MGRGKEYFTFCTSTRNILLVQFSNYGKEKKEVNKKFPDHFTAGRSICIMITEWLTYKSLNPYLSRELLETLLIWIYQFPFPQRGRTPYITFPMTHTCIFAYCQGNIRYLPFILLLLDACIGIWKHETPERRASRTRIHMETSDQMFRRYDEGYFERSS